MDVAQIAGGSQRAAPEARRVSRMLARLLAALAVLLASVSASALTELSGIAGISAGSTHTCAVTTTGAIKCWGSGLYGKLGRDSWTNSPLPVDIPRLGSGVRAVAAGTDHTCALTTGGGVYCWGANYGRLGDNSTNDSSAARGASGLASGAAAIAAAGSYTCALSTGGGVKCWGNNSSAGIESLAPADVAGLTSGVAAIAAGAGHLCALTTGGGVKCWGANYSGQLGDSGASGSSSSTPVSVTGLASGVTAIAARGDHACALTAGGAVKCWGSNSSGQLGDNKVSGFQSPIPVGVSGIASGATAVAAGEGHTCAVVAGGGVKCWGRNSDGQLGNNGASAFESPIPVDVSGLSGAVDIAGGYGHSCARTVGGGVKCWGANYSGQLGDNTTAPRLMPVDVLTDAPQTSPGVSGRIAVGSGHTCRIGSGGGAQCWGANASGQLGDNSTTNRLQPVEVSGLQSGIAAIFAGNLHTCALTSDGGAKCWGHNLAGQLGDNSTADRAQPVGVTGLASGVASLAPGYLHTCALATAGGVKCWGRNSSGQLGNNSTVDSWVPVDVSGLPGGVRAVASGDGHTCALTTGGGVKCWGANAFGQAGGNAGSDTRVPVDVPGLATGVIAIAAGWSHNCAVTAVGGVKCWGANGAGQLGDLSTTNRPVPVDLPGLASGVAAVAAGALHTCALTTAGAVKCWGSNANGRLGNNSTVASFTPVDVVGLSSGVIAIAADYYHTCALTSTGSVKCWGDSQTGQLGNGGTAESHVPVEALLARATPTVSVFLSSGVNPSARGDTLTFYAQVGSPGPGLTGTVTFRDGGAIIPGCGPTLIVGLSGGTPSQQWAYCTTSALGAGVHSITAEYSGNAEILGGTSAAHVQTVIAIDPFPFVEQDDVGLGVLATSNPVTISGFSGTQPISVTNGRYSIGCAPPYLSAPGTVSAGTVVCVHHVTPLGLGMGTTTTLTVGGVSSSFSSRTAYSSPLTPPASIAAGISHNLVIADDQDEFTWAWGDNTAGKLGINSTVSTTIPSKLNVWFMNVAAGMSHSLGLSGGQVYAWGLNRNGQLGIDPLVYSSDLCKIPGETGIYAAGTFLCLTTPVWIQGLDNVVAISAGWGHSLALKSDGTVWAWGSGEFGQNGASSGDRVTPTQVPLGGMATRIAAGYMHSVALLSDGTVVAWGQGSHGELGPATLALKNPNPTVVTGLTGVTDIAAGGGYTLARKSDLSLVGWGSNIYATMGNNSAGGFVQAPGLVMTDVAEFTAGFGFALARKTGGGVFAWGLNNRGQLNGTAQASPANCGLSSSRSCIRTPTQIPSLGGAARIVAGGAHTLTVRPNGDLVIIGDNSVGQHADKSGNYGIPFSAGRQPFVQEVYDPDTFTSPQGTFGSIGSIGRPSTTSALNLGTLAFAFDPQGVGTTSQALALTLTNLSNTDSLTISSVVAAGNAVAGEYSVPDPAGCVGVLGPNLTCTMDVFFRPAELGERYGTLTVQSNAANSNTIVVDLFGTGIDSRPTSATTLASSANPSTAGSSVTFTASISASATPTGTVEFRSDGVAISGCTAVTVAASSAACTTAALTAGTHAITANYSGSAAVQPSGSVALMQSVLPLYGLAVTRQGAGSGTVTSSPSGVNCGATCSASYASGTVVTLTAAAAAGSVFGGWSGDCTGTSCQVTMAGARNVSASFTLLPPTTFSLIVTLAGSGSGTVTSVPSGILCGAACSQSFASGLSVSLSATPQAGSTFAGWSGTCSGMGGCSVTMSAARSVTATFTANPGTLSRTPASLDFGGQSMSTPAPPQAVTITNGGGTPVTVNAITATAHFAVAHDCATLAAGASCTAQVSFTPAAQGVLNGTVTIQATAGTLSVALAGTGERSLVTHYYRSILGRAPDAGGKTYWEGEAARTAGLGVDPNEVWFAMSMSFFNSAEYINRNTSDTQYVTDLYRTFFNRDPDPGGLAYWRDFLIQGVDRAALLTNFLFSQEFANFTAAIFGSAPVRAELSMTIDFYRGILGRLPDSGGFGSWLGRIRAAQCQGATAVRDTVGELAGLFVTSAEYAAREAARPAAWRTRMHVGDLYNAFLRRGAEPSGYNAWASFVDNPPALGSDEVPGTGRERLRRKFLASPEFQARVDAVIAQGCLQ